MSGNKVTADFGTMVYGTDHSFLTDDVARFLGALHRNSGAKEIVFKDVTYVWDDEAAFENGGTVKGSAWYDASYDAYNGTTGSQNTLVSAIFGTTTSWTFPTNGEIVLYVDGAELTIKLIAKAS